ncbi:MAG: gliding motility-associated C-terminal domain-containing protein [Alphaproteobacteria bacterium]|nr:gliding motility-associated C-terminal domain-containing protein [Alphaproteobacteria bacterium]
MSFIKRVVFIFLLSFLSLKAAAQYSETLNKNPVSFYYNIPLHFHIFFKDGEAMGSPNNPSNPLNTHFFSMIDTINKIYRNYNGNSVNTSVQFYLDTIGPNGNKTTSITRSQGTLISPNYVNGVQILNKNNPADKIFDAYYCNNSGAADFSLFFNTINTWDPNKYFNIYFVVPPASNCASGFQLAYRPQNNISAASTGIMMDINSFTPRHFAHQLGHALNVLHTFEGDDSLDFIVCPKDNFTDCDEKNDFCCDTDPHNRTDTTANNPCSTDLNLWQTKTRFNLMNNYSQSYAFTEDQKSRMINAIESFQSLSVVAKKIFQFKLGLRILLDKTVYKDTAVIADTNSQYRFSYQNPNLQLWKIKNIKLITSVDTTIISNDSISNYTLSKVFTNANLIVTYELDTFKNSYVIVTKTKGGTVSVPEESIVAKGSNLTIALTPDPGYVIDSVFINGIFQGSNTTMVNLLNIQSTIRVLVKFTRFVSPTDPFIRRLTKYILKPATQIAIIGRNNVDFIIEHAIKRTKQSFNFFSKALLVGTQDTTYEFTLPANLEEGLYLVYGNKNGLYSEKFIFRIYYHDSIKVIGWGDSRYGQIEAPNDLKNVVKLSLGKDLNVALKTDGTVVEWGFVGFPILNFPSNIDNLVDIYITPSNLRIGLLSTGTLITWGTTSISVPDTIKDIIVFGGNNQINVAIDYYGKLNNFSEFNLPEDTNYLPPKEALLDTIVSIHGGNSFMIYETKNGKLYNKGINRLFDTISNVKYFSNQFYSTTLLYKNNVVKDVSPIALNLYNLKNFKKFTRGNDFICVLRPDSTVFTFGSDNILGQVTTPYYLTDILDIFSGEYYNLAMIRDVKIKTSALNSFGTISPTKIVTNLGESYQVNFTPNSGYKVDFIEVDGVRYYGDLANYRFTNIRVPHEIQVSFIKDDRPILNLTKFIYQIGDTAIIRGNNCLAFLLNYGNTTQPIHLTPIKQIVNNGSGFSEYFVIIPTGIQEGIYTLRAYNLIDTTQINLWYLYKYDSLLAIGWGNNDYNQTIIPSDIGSVVNVSAGNDISISLNTNGQFKFWGLVQSYPLSKIYSLENIVDVFSGQGGQLGVVLSDGRIEVWGNNFNNQNVNYQYAKHVIKVVGVEGALICLTWDNTIEVFGSGDSTYLYMPPPLPTNKRILDIVGGLKSVTILYVDGSTQTFGNTAVNYGYNQTQPQPAISFLNFSVKNFNYIGQNNAYQLFSYGRTNSLLNVSGLPELKSPALGENFVAGIKSDSTLFAAGTSNVYGILEPPPYKDIKKVVAGSNYAIALVPYIIINTNIGKGIGSISPNKIIFKNQIGSNVRITYSPYMNYGFDYILVNGIKITDSINGYTFYNVSTSQTIEVFFIDLSYPYLTKFDGYIKKPQDTLEITGRNLTSIIFKRGNFKDSMIISNFISIQKINTTDTLYKVNIPHQLTEGLWIVKGTNGNQITNNQLLRIYYFDSLLVATCRDTLQNANKYPNTLNNLIYINTVSYLRNDYALSLNKYGVVSGWGSFYDNSNVDQDYLNNAVDVFAGSVNQNFLLQHQGSLFGWGNNIYQQATVPKGLNNVLDVTALGNPGTNTNYFNVALLQNGTMFAWGRYVDSVYIKKLAVYKDVVKLDGNYALTDSGKIIDLLNPIGYYNLLAPYSIKDFYKRNQNSGIALLKSDSIIVWTNNNVSKYANRVFNKIAFNSFNIADINNPDTIKYYNTNFTNSSSQVYTPPHLRNMRSIYSGYDNFYVLFKLDIKTFIIKDTGGNISPNITVTSFNNKNRILFTPDPNFAVEYIELNGVRIFDSLEGYTFNNIKTPQTIGVSFVPLKYPKIISVNKYIAKPSDTLYVVARSIKYFQAISRNLKYKTTINFINYTPISNSRDTLYTIVLPNLQDEVWKFIGFSNDSFSNTHLIRIYNNDSLLVNVFGSGNNSFNHRTVPKTITNAVQISAKLITNACLDKNGKITFWGQNASYLDPLNWNINLSKVVDINMGLSGKQIFALLGDGHVVAWGSDDYSLVSNVDNFYDIVDIDVALDAGFAINASGKLISWGDNKNIYSIETINPNDTQVYLAAGLYHVLILDNNGKFKVRGNPSFRIYYNRNLPDTNQTYNAIAANDLFNASLNSNDSVIAWGVELNNFGINNTRIFSTQNQQVVRGYTFTAALKNQTIQLALDTIYNNLLVVPKQLYNVYSIAAGNNHVTSLFVLGVYTSVINPEGGTITPSLILGTLGRNVTINFQTNKGFEVDSVFLNDLPVIVTNNRYTISNILLNQTIRVKFKVQKFTITPIIINGISNPSTPQSVSYFDTFKFSYIPIDSRRYSIDSVLVNGKLVNDSTSGFTFIKVDTNIRLKVVYTIKKFRVKTTVFNGNASPNDTLVDINSNLDLNFSAYLGYEFDSMVINNIKIPLASNLNNYQITNIEDSTYVFIYFKIKRFKVYTQAINGSIEMTSWADYGSSKTIHYQPITGYEVDSIFLNNNYLINSRDSQSQYTINNITDTAYFFVKFKIKTFLIRITTINGYLNNDLNLTSLNITVNYGQNIIFSYLPKSGYLLREVVIDGVSIGKDSPTSFSVNTITKNYYIEVRFRPLIFAIIAKVEFGSVVPADTQFINFGQDVQFKYFPSPNCTFDSIFLNGVFLTKDSLQSYTLRNVTDDGVLRIVFKQIKVIPYEIITPNGDGINDYWYIYNINRFPENEIIIYNQFNIPVKTFINFHYLTRWYATDDFGFTIQNGNYIYVIKLFNKGNLIYRIGGPLIIRQ